MEYNFRQIEKKWQDWWKENKVYKVSNTSDKPKYYVLDMFPYPSGAGLHVGHPLGYIASDIYSRYKRLKGFNVLHPMGFDSFGLPAEQYAIETGQHPAETTKNNIATFKSQLDKIGFCYDWDREVQTSDPNYYKWTQKIFLELYNSYFCNSCKQAKPISELVKKYETKGSSKFTAEQWNGFSVAEKEEWLMQRRLAFSKYGEVNWCEALGTVLANDEVVNGVSERGGHPVEKKKMRQWYLRITAYAERLLQGLETVDFSDSMKEMQRNWIGRSEGAEIEFEISLNPNPSPKGEENNTPTGIKTSNKANWDILKDLSRENRKQQTEAEALLWEELRNNKTGHKVRRQHRIDSFIIDFAFLNEKVLVEVDGGYHNETEQKKYDAARTEFLQELGYTVIRFTNDEIIRNSKQVVIQIKERLAFEAPSPLGEGRGEALKLTVYTTRPDTIFGVDFMVLAPELDYLLDIASSEQKQAVEDYIKYVKSRSDRERQAEVKQVTGCFTGAYAINPFNGKEIPIYIAEYVLAGYGTGAIMAVPCGDERDFKFAQHFNIPVTNIIGDAFNGTEANPTKDAVLQNSDFLNGLVMRDAMKVANDKIEEMGIGKRKVNYRMRDAGFSRQRYWGEPFPIVWNNGVPTALTENDLPLELPHVEKYGPGPDGEGPLANITKWVNTPEGRRETSTMPGYAGSSWYFLRYMDPNNDKEFVSKQASDYWNSVDLYIGGTEHAVGHLLYSRMWTKVLFDLGYISFDEPFKKLLNQGMITGKSYFFNKIVTDDEKFLITSYDSKNASNVFQRFKYGHRYVDANNRLAKKDFVRYQSEESFEAELISQIEWLNDGNDDYIVLKEEAEKMSKSKFNVDNPDELCEKYGADTFRMYEMFLGPVEQSKPWDTKGIEGVHRFIRKMWRLFYADTPLSQGRGAGGEANETIAGKPIWTNDTPTAEELKVLHKTIKKIDEDTERFSYNTAVSAFMVCVNELSDLKCNKKEILEQLLILLTPYAPHIAEELWNALGNEGSILDANYPVFNPAILVESEKEYPVSINGKMRTTLSFSLDAAQSDIEAVVLENEVVKKWLEGTQPKKIIFVKGKMINVVI
jgi:leucyl-tRNA synthetase